MSTAPLRRPRKHQRVDASQFLDLEASVDHDADTDENAEDGNREDDFIDDDDDDANTQSQHIEFIRQLLVEEDHELEGPEEEGATAVVDTRHSQSGHFNLMDELHAHIRRRKYPSRIISSSLESPSTSLASDGLSNMHWEAGGEPVQPDSDFYGDLESRLPKRDDMLFEIPCKRGYEEAAVLSIMYLATSPKCPRGGKSPSLAAAFSNPFLPGRIFLEVKEYSHAMDVARRVPHLKPVDIIEIDLVDRLRPLQISSPTKPTHNSWVRIERPISLRDRVGLVIQLEGYPAEVIVIPKGSGCNDQGLLIEAMTSGEAVEENVAEEEEDQQLVGRSQVKIGSRLYCRAGFRYIRVDKSVLVSGDEIVPPSDELAVFLSMRKISEALYNQTLRRIQTLSLNDGDRILLTHSDLAGLVSVFHSSNASGCRVYIPSLDIYVDGISFEDIRRHFRVGDRVQTNDPRHGINNVPLWVVALENDQAVLVNLADRSELVASVHHLTFCDFDNIPLSISVPRRKSQVAKRKVYTVSFSTPLSISSSWTSQSHIKHLIGRITDIASFNTEIGTLQFTPDSFFSPPPSLLALSVGLQIELRDEHDLGGTAFISSWTSTYLTLVNLSEGFELPHDWPPPGLYDRHVGKWVFVIAGIYKGTRGLVKAVTTDGRATVELQVFPLRREIIHVTQLTAMKSDLMYGLKLGHRLVPGPDLPPVPSTSLWAATRPPIVRAVTPPAPSSDIDPFSTSTMVENDCTWLESPELQGIPIKLVSRKGLAPSSSAYHFLRVERQLDSAWGDTRVWFTDRAKERSLPMSELSWVMCTGPGQTVIMTSSENRTQLYWTLGAVDNEMMCRLEPKVANEPSILLLTSKLAQVFKPKRSSN